MARISTAGWTWTHRLLSPSPAVGAQGVPKAFLPEALLPRGFLAVGVPRTPKAFHAKLFHQHLRLHQLREQHERLLPSQVAALERDRLRQSFLHDRELGTARHRS